MGAATVALASKISKRHEANYAAFLADCEADRLRGFRPRHCEHGTYLWVDHDPICGGCEEGYSLGDPTMRRLAALAEARSRMKKIDALAVHAIQLRKIAPNLNIDSIIEEMNRLRTI